MQVKFVPCVYDGCQVFETNNSCSSPHDGVEMVDQYQSVVDFSLLLRDLWSNLGDLLVALPGTISDASMAGNHSLEA